MFFEEGEDEGWWCCGVGGLVVLTQDDDTCMDRLCAVHCFEVVRSSGRLGSTRVINESWLKKWCGLLPVDLTQCH